MRIRMRFGIWIATAYHTYAAARYLCGQYRLAQNLGVPAPRISQVVHGKRAVTADIALRLARSFNTSAHTWLRLPARYDLDVAEEYLAERVVRKVTVYRRHAPAAARSPAGSRSAKNPAGNAQQVTDRRGPRVCVPQAALAEP